MASLLVLASAICGLSVGKIYELYHRDHYHDEMQDTPKGSRYASVLAFYNDTKQCKGMMAGLPWTETGLPSVEHLFLGQYELSTSRDRVWYVLMALTCRYFQYRYAVYILSFPYQVPMDRAFGFSKICWSRRLYVL